MNEGNTLGAIVVSIDRKKDGFKKGNELSLEEGSKEGSGDPDGIEVGIVDGTSRGYLRGYWALRSRGTSLCWNIGWYVPMGSWYQPLSEDWMVRLMGLLKDSKLYDWMMEDSMMMWMHRLEHKMVLPLLR